MDKLWNSSGRFSQDSLQWESSIRFNRWWENYENFRGSIIFMSMFNDIGWDAKGNDELCVNCTKTIKEYTERFPRGHLYGAVAEMIEELPVDQRAPVKPVHQVSWINKKFFHNLLSQNCKPMKSDKETYCKNTSNDWRNYQKTRSYPDYAPKQVWD